MDDKEKWYIFNAMEDYIFCDFHLTEDELKAYDMRKDTVWCSFGHYMISDQCGLPEHDFCKYCGITQEQLGGKTE
jgi:hypothetical protein